MLVSSAVFLATISCRPNNTPTLSNLISSPIPSHLPNHTITIIAVYPHFGLSSAIPSLLHFLLLPLTLTLTLTFLSILKRWFGQPIPYNNSNAQKAGHAAKDKGHDPLGREPNHP
jgi:hypothetical protein